MCYNTLKVGYVDDFDFTMDKFLTNKQRKLITDNHKLLDDFIDHIIRKQIIPKRMEDDFISDMYLKFCFSALKYDINTGFKFSTYAYGGFQLGIKDIITKKREKFERIKYIDDDYMIACNLDDQKKPNLQIEEMDSFINNAELTSKEKSMLEDYYYSRITFSKLGEKYNISKETARLFVKRVVKKLKIRAKNQKIEFEDFYV
jgi:RNA polymerase sigma factor (sigma-70 family)